MHQYIGRNIQYQPPELGRESTEDIFGLGNNYYQEIYDYQWYRVRIEPNAHEISHKQGYGSIAHR